MTPRPPFLEVSWPSVDWKTQVLPVDVVHVLRQCRVSNLHPVLGWVRIDLLVNPRHVAKHLAGIVKTIVAPPHSQHRPLVNVPPAPSKPGQRVRKDFDILRRHGGRFVLVARVGRGIILMAWWPVILSQVRALPG